MKRSSSAPATRRPRPTPFHEEDDDDELEFVSKRLRRMNVVDESSSSMQRLEGGDMMVRTSSYGYTVRAPRSVKKRCRVEQDEQQDMQYFIERVSRMNISGTMASNHAHAKRIRTSEIIRAKTPPPSHRYSSTWSSGRSAADLKKDCIASSVQEFNDSFVGSREPIPVPELVSHPNDSLKLLHYERQKRLHNKMYSGPKLKTAEPVPSAKPFFE